MESGVGGALSCMQASCSLGLNMLHMESVLQADSGVPTAWLWGTVCSGLADSSKLFEDKEEYL